MKNMRFFMIDADNPIDDCHFIRSDAIIMIKAMRKHCKKIERDTGLIDGSLSDFIDHLYYGQEIVFSYNGRKYFIQGWWSDDKSESTMVLDDLSEEHEDDYIWECHAQQ